MAGVVEVARVFRRTPDLRLAFVQRLTEENDGGEEIRMRGLRGLAVGIISISLIGCASKPEPLVCSVLGAMTGAFAGGVAAGEYEGGGDSSGGAVAIGVGSTALGLGIGYLLCRPWPKKPEPQLAQAMPPPEPPAPAPPPPPPLPPIPPPPPPPDPCEGIVRLAGVNFDIAKATIRPDALMILDGVAAQLKRCGKKRLSIEAHSDWTGSDEYNLDLSLQRADAVVRYLARAGVAPERMYAVGFGESRPIASNETPEGRAKNRRVELRPIE